MRALDSQSDVKSSAWLGRQSIEEYCNLINTFLNWLTWPHHAPRTSPVTSVVIDLWLPWPSEVITTLLSVGQLPFSNISFCEPTWLLLLLLLLVVVDDQLSHWWGSTTRTNTSRSGGVAGLVNRQTSNDIKLPVFLAEPCSYNISLYYI